MEGNFIFQELKFSNTSPFKSNFIQQLALKYQLLAELLSTLEAEGFSFGLEEHLRWQQLLGRLPDDIDPAQLKTIVCPLLAKDEEEQALIYEVFDECLERVVLLDSVGVKGIKKGWKLPIPLPWLLFWVIMFVSFLVLLFIPVKKREAPRIIDSTYATVAPGQTKKICLDPKKLEGKPRMIGSQVIGKETRESIAGSFTYRNSCVNYTANNLKGADTINVEFMELDGFRWYTTFYIFVNEIQLDTIEKPIAQKRINKNKALFFYKQYPFENDIRELITPPLSAIEEFYQKYAKWIKLFLALTIIGILTKILLDREEKRKKLVASTANQKDVFPIWKLAAGLLGSTTTGTAFYTILNKLRKRTPDDFYRLNIPKTVDRTIKKAGMVEFQYDLQTRPPEYILLVDGASQSNHLSKLFELLIEHFKANEVYIERFFLHPENQLCYNEDFPKGMNLAALQERYYNSKLLLLAAKYEPKVAFFNKLDHWKSTFDHWENAALLLPVPILAEVSDDHSLKDVFEVIPASLSGINFLLDQQNGSASKANKAAEETRQKSVGLADEKVDFIPFLKKHFSEPLIVWIAACSIYPSLHWSLTTQIGKLLNTKENELLSLENLFALTTIPWFISGEIPETNRNQLLAYLEKEHTGLYGKLKTNIEQILENDTSFNEGQIAENQEPIIGVDKKILEKELAEDTFDKSENFATSGTTQQAEFPVITKLDRKETLLDFIIPKKWKQNLKQLGFPNLGHQEFWKDVIRWALPILIAALSFLWWLPEEWDNCDGELVEYVYNEVPLTLCINTPEERILLNEYLARDAILAQQEGKVDSLTKAVAKVLKDAANPANLPPTGSPLDSARLSFNGNVSVEYYNRGVQFYNNFLQSNNASEEEEAANTLKTEACYHFDRAYQFDTIDIDMKNAVEWCLRKKEPKTINLQGNVVDAFTDSVLINAKVTYESQVTVTDSLGQFSFVIPQSADTQAVQLVTIKVGYFDLDSNYAVTVVDSNLIVNEVIRLSPDPALMKTYVLSGTITDKETKGQPIVPINIFREKELETIAKEGQFRVEFAQNSVVNNKVKIRLEGQGYQTILQEVFFDGFNELKLDLEIEPVLSDNFETIASDETALDSLDYLLNRVLELNEAPTPINFDIPKPEMKFIEGSTFAMGDVMGDNSTNTELPHVVTLSSYYIGIYEVTFDEFDRFTDMTGEGSIGDAGWGRGRQPAFQVSWYQAIRYCNWLSEQLGYDKVYSIDENRQDPNNKSRQDRQKWTVTADWTANGFRLPTEAEWEYAARQGGEKIRFGNGKDIADPAEINYATEAESRIPFVKTGQNRRQTVEVGSLPANSKGLHEMSGNVPEWCWDWLGPYPNHAATNPTGAEFGNTRILRGGSFGFTGKDAKTYSRYGSVPTRVNGLGFRLCRSAK